MIYVSVSHILTRSAMLEQESHRVETLREQTTSVFWGSAAFLLTFGLHCKGLWDGSSGQAPHLLLWTIVLFAAADLQV